MRWNVICRIGENDDFAPNINHEVPRLIVEFDNQAQSKLAANRVISLLLKNGLKVDETIFDLLIFAMSIYTTDLRIERSFASDRWTRRIILHQPVAEPAKWEEAQPVLEKMLGFLTGDDWTFKFRPRHTIKHPAPEQREELPSVVSLFSGGLDSFVGTIDLLEENKGNIALVGQYGSGSTHPSQINTHQILIEKYAGRTLPLGFWIQPAKPGKKSSEDTMRSRSILFLAHGTAVATACGNETPLYVPENGLISLNVPLSHSRMGSFSTRTTHPYFISCFREFLAALNINVPVNLPYKFLTKGEMLRDAKNQEVLREGLARTLSCSRPDAGRFEKRPPGTHCGYCVPCIIRLSSMKAAGFEIKDAAFFDIANVKTDPKTAKGRDRRGFELAIERVKNLSSLRLVGEVLQSGPLPPENIQEYAGVYKRGLDEVADLLQV
ncbi:MAG TPA: hypothetical protein PKY82_04465 [Pyrinomonadaceae bacterium]|nr:hypothetical protein [Pyrinomonadaceae bacterium]